MVRKGAIVVGLAALALGGCASSSAGAPAWFQQRTAEQDSSYPSLRSVPRSYDANTDQQHWNAVEQETLAAAAELRANPRAQYGEPPEDPATFVEDARQILEATRQSHE